MARISWQRCQYCDTNFEGRIKLEKNHLYINVFIVTMFLLIIDIDHIVTVRDNSPVTLDFCPTRIRVFVNEKNIVTVEPRIG